jgi:hypothetical protein
MYQITEEQLTESKRFLKMHEALTDSSTERAIEVK